MPLVSETFPSRFLKAVDLKGREHHVRIISVEQQVIGDPPKTVLVASFANRSKSWVLNKTNSYALAAVYAWVGRDVVLYETTTPFRGMPTPTIRCRVPRIAEPKTSPVELVKQLGSTAHGNAADKVMPVLGNANGGRDDMDDEIPF